MKNLKEQLDKLTNHAVAVSECAPRRIAGMVNDLPVDVDGDEGVLDFVLRVRDIIQELKVLEAQVITGLEYRKAAEQWYEDGLLNPEQD